MKFSPSRRRFIDGVGVLTLAGMLPLRLALAAAPTDKRLLLVILRGGLDGLAAVIPYRDPHYYDARGAMAMPENGDALVDLDGYFALHSALAPLAELYHERELLVLHAAASPYRERSHFDAQDLLENGGNRPHDQSTGWLNRTLAALPGAPAAMAIGPSVPLVLRGNAPVSSWAPPGRKPPCWWSPSSAAPSRATAAPTTVRRGSPSCWGAPSPVAVSSGTGRGSPACTRAAT